MVRKIPRWVWVGLLVSVTLAACGSGPTAAETCGGTQSFIVYTTGGPQGAELYGSPNGATNAFAVSLRGDGDYSARVIYPDSGAYILMVKAGNDASHLITYGSFTAEQQAKEVIVPAVQANKPGETPGAINQTFYVCGSQSKPS